MFGMIKVIGCDSFQWDEPPVQLIKIARGGLRGHDLKAFEKRASSTLLSSLNRGLADGLIKAGEELIHMFAVGATEDYGANRNGDGFRRVTCRNWHPTFEKYACFYRNHANKDPHKSYGRVVKSAFHDPMKRIELLAALYATKEAAARYQACIADSEMEKLASGREIPVSMACKVPYDICSWCGNHAPRVSDYCTGIDQGGRCKAGGLRDRIGSVVEVDGEVHHLHADNDQPTFFDISHVFRPADRIAYVTGQLEKAAAARGGGVVKSAELAAHLGISVPHSLLLATPYPSDVGELVKTAGMLAAIESDVASHREKVAAFAPSVQDETVEIEWPAVFREKFSTAMRALSDARIVLPLSRFLEVAAGQTREKAAELAELVARELPGIYSRLASDPELPEKVADCRYCPSQATAAPRYMAWAERQSPALSLKQAHVVARLKRAALQSLSPTLRVELPQEKTAAASDPVRRMAEEYAIYKLAFVASLPKNEPDNQLTAILAVLQNYSC